MEIESDAVRPPAVEAPRFTGRPDHACALAGVIILTMALASNARAQAPQDIADQAARAFIEGRVAESVASFDRLATLVPSAAPTLWQRGIALYVLGRYDECAAQFLSYFGENPRDLENAAWHFLCTARRHSVDVARATLLEAGPDSRVLRAEIYQMLRGSRTPESLLEIVRGTTISIARFYAHLYVGLFLDASGDRVGALEHLHAAASPDFRGDGGFMSAVPRVYLATLEKE
jgi:lipoprotein NlpI